MAGSGPAASRLVDRLADLHGLALLVDPGRTAPAEAEAIACEAERAGTALLLLGNSFGGEEDAGAVARAIKQGAPGVPLLQFPAHAAQLVPDVDGVLLLSLVSGRNAQYLVEEHVRAVPFFLRHPHVAAVSTAYILVDGGHVTSVEAVSQTRPLPADKPELLAAHVHAARLIGMRATYLEAGSGAQRAVSPALVRAARRATGGALFVGGGIRDAAGVRAARAAGADFVVVGTQVERAGAHAIGALAAAARA